MFNYLPSFIKSKKVQLVLVLGIANLALFYKLYFYRLFPFPGDLLVAFYFPWNSGGFVGYNSWTTHKNSIAADVVRQIYPWRQLAIDSIKNLQLPLWNPLNFSGTPLLANLQSSVLFPGNILFFLLPFLHAWIIQVCLLLSIFSLFTYLFLRSVNRSHWSALFGAVAAGGISYLLVWQEQLVVIQSALFLPLILYFINRYSDNKSKNAIFIIPILIAFTIFGGHIQTSTYVLMITLIYMFYKKVGYTFTIRSIVIGLILSAVQLVPSAELYFQSAREVASSRYLFDANILPIGNIITFLAPDFYGNPATANFWGQDYGNFQAFFGIAAFVLSLFAIFLNKIKEVRFWMVVFIGSLLFSMYPAHLFEFLKIPILSSSAPARLLFLTQFSGVILSAFGLDYLIENRGKMRLWHYLIALVPVTVLFALFVFTFFFENPNLLVSRNNLKLPLLISGLLYAGLIVYNRVRLRIVGVGLFITLILLVSAEYGYFFNKYSPFASANFVFPKHRVISFLQDRAGLDRFYGYWSSYIDNNFSTQFRTYSTEGYDSLYIKRYGQLVSSARDGKLHQDIQRSDAVFTQDDTPYRQRLFDLLGVKYVLDKNDDFKSDWEPELLRFPQGRYFLFWQSEKWKAYQRKTVLPRTFLAGGYEVISGDEQIISRLHSLNFDYRDNLILESDPQFKAEKGGINRVDIIKYSPNEVNINVNSDRPKLLFLSDSYYSGWEATINGKPTPTYRADYVFRAIKIFEGNSKVVFSYNPMSFKVGLILSLTGLLLNAVFLLPKRKDMNN